MKIRLLTILLLAVSTVAFSQDYKKEIEKQFLEYNNLIVKRDFEKSMDFAPEEFFKIIPKDQMILVMEKTFNNPEMEFELKEPEISEITESQKIEDKFYSLVNYSSLMNMKFKNNDQKEETDTEHKLRMNMIKLSFEKTFGSENVKYDEKTEVFEVNAQKQAYAISKNGKTDWKFLVIEKKQRFILDKLLPRQLAEKI